MEKHFQAATERQEIPKIDAAKGSYLLGKTMLVKYGVQVYEAKQMSDGRQHALANMVPTFSLAKRL